VSWLPFVWTNYWVLALAPDYSVAAVGDSGREYLWILSRTPHLPDSLYEEMVNQVTAQGYDTARLVKTKQEQ
jgi:apolipoprotein D and lipocalin family protein